MDKRHSTAPTTRCGMPRLRPKVVITLTGPGRGAICEQSAYRIEETEFRLHPCTADFEDSQNAAKACSVLPSRTRQTTTRSPTSRSTAISVNTEYSARELGFAHSRFRNGPEVRDRGLRSAVQKLAWGGVRKQNANGDRWIVASLANNVTPHATDVHLVGAHGE